MDPHETHTLTNDPERQGRNHTTGDELAFLRDLGTGAYDPGRSEARTKRPLADRTTLLRRYFAAMPLRHDWGDVDPVRIRQAVLKLLEHGERTQP